MENTTPRPRPQADYSELEVVSHPSLHVAPESTLEVVSDDGRTFTEFYAIPKPHDAEESTPAANEEKIATTEASSNPQRNRRKYYIIGAIVAIIVILAAVLGGVLGSRKSASKDSDASESGSNENSNSTSSSATSNDVPSSTEIASDSRLAFSAWKDDKGFVRHIFYQQPNGTLRACMSSGSGSVDDAGWQKPTTLNTLYPAQNKTGLATALTVQNVNGNGKAVQVEIFLLNSTSYVNADNYGRSFQYSTDSINVENFPAMQGSELAAYWPNILYQSQDGLLQMIRFTPKWTTTTLSIRAKPRSKLSLVPTSRNVTKIASSGRYAIFYRTEKGQLSTLEDPLELGADESYSVKSPPAWNASFPDIEISDEASFAAFSVASDDSDDDTVTAFLLYQDSESRYNQVWRDGTTNKWKTSKPDAFKNADKEASIACVTGPTWLNEADVDDRLLEPASDFTRCVFVEGGKIMETQLDGVDWKTPKEVKFGSWS